MSKETFRQPQGLCIISFLKISSTTIRCSAHLFDTAASVLMVGHMFRLLLCHFQSFLNSSIINERPWGIMECWTECWLWIQEFWVSILAWMWSWLGSQSYPTFPHWRSHTNRSCAASCNVPARSLLQFLMGSSSLCLLDMKRRRLPPPENLEVMSQCCVTLQRHHSGFWDL